MPSNQDNSRASQAASGRLNPDVVFNNFTGGRVNVPQVVDPSNLMPGQSPRSRNVDTSGTSIRKMKGFSKVTETDPGGDISTIYYDVFEDDVFVGYDTEVGKITGTTITPLSGSSGAYTANGIWSMVRSGDYVIMTNGTQAPIKWNGTTTTAITTIPVTWTGSNYPKAFANWMGRAFAYDLANEPDILYFSELYDADDWTAGVAATSGGAIRIGNDGIPIRAVVPLAEGLLIFKDPGLYLLTGTTDSTGRNFDQTSFDWQQLAAEVDCRGSRAVVTTQDAVFSWGRSSIWKLEGSIEQQRISATKISNLISYDVTNVTTLGNQICGVHYPDRNQIWFGVASNGGSAIDTIHVFDYVNNQLFLRDGYSHKCMANVRDSAGKIQIYSGGYDGNGYIFLQNSTTDYDDAAMECQYYTDWRPMAATAACKPGLVIFTLGSQTTRSISYTYAYDYNPGSYGSFMLEPASSGGLWTSNPASSEWGAAVGGAVGTWNTGNTTQITKLLYGKGRRIQHRFYSNQVGANFAILEVRHPSITIGYR